MEKGGYIIIFWNIIVIYFYITYLFFRFIDICIGYPGKVHDANVFSNSDFFRILYIRIYSVNSIMLVYLNNNVLFYKLLYLLYFITQDNERLVILCDAAYPTLLWLVKPWPWVNYH